MLKNAFYKNVLNYISVTERPQKELSPKRWVMVRPQGYLRHVLLSVITNIYTKKVKMISDVYTPPMEKYQEPKIKTFLQDRT